MKPSQTIFKFDDTTSALRFRPDGGLLSVGEANGRIQVFELKNKYALRQYPEEHQNARINCLSWSQGNLKNFISCANDANLKMYDIQESGNKACLSVVQAHSDNIKKAQFVPKGFQDAENDLTVISCSQDHFVKLWDLRKTDESLCQFKLENPVEDFCFAPAPMQPNGEQRLVIAHGNSLTIASLNLSN